MSAQAMLVADAAERDCRFPVAAQILPIMSADDAFDYLAAHHPDELARLLRRYPECVFADIPY